MNGNLKDSMLVDEKNIGWSLERAAPRRHPFPLVGSTPGLQPASLTKMEKK